MSTLAGKVASQFDSFIEVKNNQKSVEELERPISHLAQTTYILFFFHIFVHQVAEVALALQYKLGRWLTQIFSTAHGSNSQSESHLMTDDSRKYSQKYQTCQEIGG